MKINVIFEKNLFEKKEYNIIACPDITIEQICYDIGVEWLVKCWLFLPESNTWIFCKNDSILRMMILSIKNKYDIKLILRPY